MPFNTSITFVREVDKRYNPETSLHEATLKKRSKLASVTNMGATRSIELFGEMDTQRYTVRLRSPYNEPFDYIIIRGVPCKPVMKRRALRWTQGVIVEETVVMDYGDSRTNLKKEGV